MLLCIYDLWESLVFLSPSDSFLNELTDSLSFLVCTFPVADISLLARIPVASEDRLTADIDPTPPLTRFRGTVEVTWGGGVPKMGEVMKGRPIG
jgi:hypothetical protein